MRDLGYRVACLVIIVSENPDSYMLHTPNILMAEMAAKALQIPVVLGNTKGEKELELRDIEAAVLETKSLFDVKILASGGLASQYQKNRLGQVANGVGLLSVNPLWG